MKVLLTNDDGIDAPGLNALAGVVEGEVYVAAPDRQRSECGHQVTTRSPIAVERRGERGVAVDGTPADCVRLALRGGLFGDVEFDWVLSGINEGGNLGVDCYISGTVAAAREAAILGTAAVALSHYRRAQLPIDWTVSQERARSVLNALILQPKTAPGFWNVNFPHGEEIGNSPEMVYCPPSNQPLPVAYQLVESDYQYCGVYAERIGEPGSDVAHCFAGRIAVSRMTL